MKIIKKWREDYKNAEYILKCDKCGCEFIVTRSEMVVAGHQYNELIYLHPCPECENSCFVTESDQRNRH